MTDSIINPSDEMTLDKFNSLPSDKKLEAAVKVLNGVQNSFTRNVLLQWKKGYTLSKKQTVHIILLAEQQLTSLARGYTGIDYSEDEDPIEQMMQEVEDSVKPLNVPVIHMGLPMPKPKIQPKLQKVWRYKHKYRVGDIQPLLDAYEIDCKRGVNPENDKELGWIVGGDFYETLRDFVVWITDENPEHPLAGAVKDYPELDD